MRKFLVPLLAIITVIAVAALSIFLFNAKDKTPSASGAATESWLYSLQSAGTTDFDQSSSVFSVPVGSLVGFSDRPFRDIQDLTLTDFVALWDDTSKDSFSADPPNAALTYWDSAATDAVAHTVIVEITGDLSSAGNVLSMKLKILSPSGATLPAKMYWASLFIDNEVTSETCAAATAAYSEAVDAYFAAYGTPDADAASNNMTTQMNSMDSICTEAEREAKIEANTAAEIAANSPECAAATTAYYNAQNTGNNFEAAWAEYQKACDYTGGSSEQLTPNNYK